ncbi:WD40/YVTN/BNR-like repeat-containing protein [Neobacillus drentensis]|uniref:WD40/YVTN/BNR-like repeat-containing protein n=1 Tax=Neobacillus drentensis TaxID=220684 RepID=UPI002FFFFCED
MTIGSNQDASSKKSNKIIIWLFIALLVTAGGTFGYRYYMLSKIKPPEGFSIEVDKEDLALAGTKWLEAYIGQYRKGYVPRDRRVVEYSTSHMEVKEDGVLQIDFSIVTRKLDERTSSIWNGVLEQNSVKCQWVLRFRKDVTSDGNYIYKVDKLQSPAGYDLEKYQTSGQKERDEYKQKFEAEIPYEKKQYTYKIENKTCYVSYDEGLTWKQVPVSINKLTAVGDGRPYLNQLQEGSFIITPEKTAFVYGGTREAPLTLVYSEDRGETWKSTEISTALQSARVRFCSFPSTSEGYIIVAGDRAMSQEMQIIYQTTDGGSSWKEVGKGARTSLLQSGGFVESNLGFMSYPKIQGAETNFYRTEDGGKTFEPVIIPVVKQEYLGMTLEPFIQPETPYSDSGQMYLLVGQGPEGDFKGGTLMVRFKSTDKGKTWSFVDLVEPPAKKEAG